MIVVAPPAPGAREYDQEQSFRVIRRPFFSRGFYPSWVPFARALEGLAAELRPDLIVFGHYAPYALVGPRIRHRLGIPYVLYTHGLDTLSYTTTIAHRVVLRRVFQEADVVLANSDWTRRQIATVCREDRIAVLYPPVSDPCSPQAPVSSQRLFSVGRLERIKGFDVALEALALLSKDFPDIHYTVAGSGSQSTPLRSLITERRLERQVTLIPTLSRDEQCRQLAAAALFVQPSRSIRHRTFVQEESFGLAALEAGAAGRAVVATEVGGVPEAVIHGQTGVLVPPDDPAALAGAIRDGFRDPARLRRLGDAGRIRAVTQRTPENFMNAFRLLTDQTPLPKISVCIPAWNAAATLERCLRSLTRQAYPNTEILLVDDGSTDSTRAIAARFPRVRVIAGEHRGAAAARNSGAEAATGELLFFSDADCIHAPQALTQLWRALRNHPDCSFAYSSFKLGWKLFRLQRFDPWQLRERNYISTRALIRRADFPGYDESVQRLQDWDLWLTMAERGQRGIWIDAVLYTTIASSRVISSAWFPKFLYRFPALADRLSRGAGLTLRQAEEIVRRKHARPSRQRPFPDPVCPRCRTPLQNEQSSLACPTCRQRFRLVEGIPILLHDELLTDFKRLEITAHTPVRGWSPDRVASRSAWYHRQAKQDLLRLPTGSQILEVACGERPDSFELAARGFHVVATDIAAARIQRAATSAQHHGLLSTMRFAVADGEHLPFPDQSFDAVLIAASFHHFPKPQRALHELRRVCRPGGLIVLELEPQRWPYQLVFPILEPLRRLLRGREHEVEHSAGDDSTEGFSRADLLLLCRAEGLIPITLRPAKIMAEWADQGARLVGKIIGKNWEAPGWLHRLLEPIDLALCSTPLIRAAAWHWNLVARVP